MSYLSRRMREEGFWLRRRMTIRRSGDVAITLTVDVSSAVRTLERAAAAAGEAARALADFARMHLDVALDPWQVRMIEAVYADPVAAARAGQAWLRPDPTNPPPTEAATRLSWDLVLVDEFHQWDRQQRFDRERNDFWSEMELRPRQNGKWARRFEREHLGIWPDRREPW